ncbi:hypothetical protein [Streptomyces sp. NPDC048248]|uniref:hypothetical protein n=1 Tax=Streptomyces sp. NPDC048248 TaxID=3365523 RepID=UPI003719D320
MVLSALGLLMIMLPLTVGGEHDWPTWTFTTMAAGRLLLTVFLVQQKSKMRRSVPTPAAQLWRTGVSVRSSADLRRTLMTGGRATPAAEPPGRRARLAIS